MKTSARSFLFLLALLIPVTGRGVAAPAPPALPIPRFVSLRADVVNLRTGPGTRYPVSVVYHRANVPVEVVAQFNVWREVKDWQGTEGWVHESLLSSRRMMVVTGEKRRLRAEPSEQAATEAYVEPDVIGRLLRCTAGQDYCRVEIGKTSGWMLRSEIWGVLPNEPVE